ncbi:MAG TPA: hydantoinase/oxoprolinase family protein [Rhizomicrobium sp.]
MTAHLRMGIDVGGTFTDIVLYDPRERGIWSAKVATTPENPVVGALEGIDRILHLSGSSASAVGFVGHGTTIATNLVVEGKGAPTALLTTRGFRDILEIRRAARHDRADLYDLFFDSPAPLVPRRRRFEIDERVLHDGTVERPLDGKSLDRALCEIRRSGAEAVAIVFLNSHANAAHEIDALTRAREALPGIFATASHRVDPDMFEYERTSTTVINAMLGPRVSAYVRAFADGVARRGVAGDVFFMQSNGGLAAPAAMLERPVALLESGPAAGVTAAAKLCRQLGISHAITGDMGGTTFDVSLIRDQRPEMRTLSHLSTHVVRAPTIDIESIGAGGGSIAWIDEAGGLHVGPESAGADPGPACYGGGGERPTVTDCNAVLGYLDARNFAGGALDIGAARRAIDTYVARPLGIGMIEAAHSVRRIANALMAQAIRLMTVERGFDPRDFAYVCFGGGGAIHAIDLASELQIPRIVVPPLPGLFSAYGMLVADQLYDMQAPLFRRLDEIDAPQLDERLADLETQMRAHLQRHAVPAPQIEIAYRADCRYVGQAESLLIAIAKDDVSPSRLAADFEAAHGRHWNFAQPGRPVVIDNLRIRARVPTDGTVPGSGEPPRRAAPPPVGERAVMLDAKFEPLPVYRRADLAEGARLAGPLIIDEPSSCLVLPRGWSVTVAPDLSLLISAEAA